MMDFDVKRCTRRCAASDRELQPDEPFYSVLLRDGADLVRLDYCESAWQGPPPGAVGCWKSRMPSAQAKRAKLAPNEVMLSLLVELDGQPQRRQLRYLLALMLVRRRLLQLQGTEQGEQGEEHLMLQHGKDEVLRVEVASPADAAEADALQQELESLLYADDDRARDD